MNNSAYCSTCNRSTRHEKFWSVLHGEFLLECLKCAAHRILVVKQKPRRHGIVRGNTGGRKENPSPRSLSAQKKQASDLYRDFTGHEAGEVVTIDKPDFPDVMSVIGDIDGILYSVVRDGVLEKYIHKFKKNSRPLFCVAPDGLSLFMIGGSYEFGDRGIVDK